MAHGKNTSVKTRRTLTKGFSIDPDFWEEVSPRVESRHAGNLSKYVITLMHTDLEGSPDLPKPSDDQCLKKLLKNYCPTRAAMINECIDDINQPLLVGKMLEALAECLEQVANRPELSIDLKRPFDIEVDVSQKRDIGERMSGSDQYEEIRRETPPPRPSLKEPRQRQA